jgi:mitochondrial fission protein ELM1
MQALEEITACSRYELAAPSAARSLLGLIAGRAPFAADLPAPDLIIGAGHGTHLALLCARRARGGRTVVLMRPSLPLCLFDFCLIPEHDAPPPRPNVIPTRGPLNTVTPAARRETGAGLILIGGPSRHYGWDNDALLEQVRGVTADRGRHWCISDSPRTPADTRRDLAGLAGSNSEYVPYNRCAPGWLEGQMARAEVIWISRDSMSMLYEALTSGAAVGLLNVPPRRESRLTRAAGKLIEAGLVTPIQDWQGGAQPAPPVTPFNEARRCAALLLANLGSTS